MFTITSSTVPTFTWNGGVCSTCGARYLGAHRCTREDIDRQIDALRRLRDMLPVDTDAPYDRTRNCPCRPENGGSGVCGCTLGGPQVTC